MKLQNLKGIHKCKSSSFLTFLFIFFKRNVEGKLRVIRKTRTKEDFKSWMIKTRKISFYSRPSSIYRYIYVILPGRKLWDKLFPWYLLSVIILTFWKLQKFLHFDSLNIFDLNFIRRPLIHNPAHALSFWLFAIYGLIEIQCWLWRFLSSGKSQEPTEIRPQM